MLFTLLLSLITGALAINLLPCTNNVDQQILQTARDIIEEYTPPGYTLVELVPHVTLGRNPHRWIASFSRNDNHYQVGCAYLVSTKKDFQRTCPPGSEIRTVSVQAMANQECIVVEILVNCYCQNVPRRRRRRRYVREPSLCNAFCK